MYRKFLFNLMHLMSSISEVLQMLDFKITSSFLFESTKYQNKKQINKRYLFIDWLFDNKNEWVSQK